ncbi:MAG: gamma-glutamyl-gamma-aminobutyrate hydrolase family protein [Cyanobium sp. M30B3]|jgi:GMP synthase (glutamine-hydrolysing)|nr:MAG: gamma-glutamyl-gamma-aminobutyrate hydrolase family protein [Cyanobium sp. M30B3]
MTRLVVLQHLEREGPGLFAIEAERRGWPVQVVRLDLGQPLPQLKPHDLLLVLGGPMGVGDQGDPAYPWLEGEVELLRQALARQQPLIGVCLGAQLLALAGGGTAIPLQVGEPPRPLREVGFGAISWCVDRVQDSAAAQLLRGLAASELVLHWHGDRCVLPPAAELLASSLHCREQAFRIGARAVGLQFHVEVQPEQLELWLEQDRDFVVGALGPGGVQAIRADAERWGAQVARQGERLIANLLDQLTTEQRPARGDAVQSTSWA